MRIQILLSGANGASKLLMHFISRKSRLQGRAGAELAAAKPEKQPRIARKRPPLKRRSLLTPVPMVLKKPRKIKSSRRSAIQ